MISRVSFPAGETPNVIFCPLFTSLQYRDLPQGLPGLYRYRGTNEVRGSVVCLVHTEAAPVRGKELLVNYFAKDMDAQHRFMRYGFV